MDLLKPIYTSTLDTVGVSATHPVRVGSWVCGEGKLRTIPPRSDDYPGWHYGLPVYTPDLQDHRPHDHAHFEISIIRRGTATHSTSYVSEELGPNTVIVIAPWMVHSIYGVKGLHQTNLYYLTEWLADDLMTHWREVGLVPMFLAAALFRRPHGGPIIKFQLEDHELAKVDAELADITRESTQDKPSLTYLRSSLLKVLIQFSRSYAHQSPLEVSLGFRDEVVDALQRIEETILRYEPFHVGELASQLDLCPDHFSAIFRESTGWSPMTYYQRRRVQHACNHLLDLSRSVTDIAHELGFCDSAHFSNVFKKHQGMSPNTYRRRYTGPRDEVFHETR